MICASSVLSIFVKHTAQSIDIRQFDAFLHDRQKVIELLLSYEDICNFAVAIYSSKTIRLVDMSEMHRYLKSCRIHCILRHFSLGCDNYFNKPVDEFYHLILLNTDIALNVIPATSWANIPPQAGSLSQ